MIKVNKQIEFKKLLTEKIEEFLGKKVPKHRITRDRDYTHSGSTDRSSTRTSSSGTTHGGGERSF